MRFFLILFLLLFSYTFAADQYCQEIQALTEEIESYPIDLCPVELKNERGLFLFLSNEYELAIKDFEDIIERFESRGIGDRSIYASAIWGKFLAHAYSDKVDESVMDLFLIRRLFLHSDCNCEEENFSPVLNLNRGFSTLKVADFADPDERISPGKCKQRVKGVAIAMKALCLKIPNATVRFATEVSICELEQKAYGCCEREHWTECLNPIVDAWQYLKDCMDKGVKYAPYVLFPSSNIHSEKAARNQGELIRV